MKAKKTFSNWLFNRYLLIIRNEENFAEKSTFGFTYAKFIVFSFTFCILILLLSFFLVETLLSQWFDPRHSQMEANRQLIELSIELDSLEYEVYKKQQFIENFQNILTGNVEQNPETEFEEDKELTELKAGTDKSDFSEIDSQFRQQFESGEINQQLALNRAGSLVMQEIFFFSPIDGIISSKYDSYNQHYGIDIVAKRNEPVKCITDGTVILSSWTQDSGYVIAVQHRGDLISVYKHNAELLKKVGNFVGAGEIISITGNTGELTDGPHLHFELWFKGNPVNPEEFVSL